MLPPLSYSSSSSLSSTSLTMLIDCTWDDRVVDGRILFDCEGIASILRLDRLDPEFANS